MDRKTRAAGFYPASGIRCAYPPKKSNFPPRLSIQALLPP